MQSKLMIVVGVVTLGAIVAVAAIYQLTRPDVVVATVSLPFEQSSEQALDPHLCVTWTVSGTLDGERRSFADGSKWAHGTSDIGEIEGVVLDPRLELAFTDGCGGKAIEIDAVLARWGFTPGCSAVELSIEANAGSESVAGCVLEARFGVDGDGHAVPGAESSSSSYTAANTGRTVEFDGTLPLGDGGVVCFGAVADITGYVQSEVYASPLEMQFCA